MNKILFIVAYRDSISPEEGSSGTNKHGYTYVQQMINFRIRIPFPRGE